ncbi:nucleosidase [Kocuria soli]|uniref:Nucleosidase n=1 Tax=Kocuria soli TaxID=2485125 RepID=A0A3N4A085_9MICC|nr:nucleosidase [Kocuria soli]ROZ64808.1 nucleosidase [Kocuria soli]
MNRLLVVAAHPAETAHLPAGTDVVLTGIGMSLAAAVTTRAVMERVPDPQDRAELTVVNLGSCGALKSGTDGLFEPSTVINRDVDADLMRAMGSDPADTMALVDLGQVGDGTVLATGDSFMAGGPVRDALAQRADLVDMEGFAVAVACRHLGVPLRMVKHVSDDADAQALNWADRVDISARALAEWFRAYTQSHDQDTDRVTSRSAEPVATQGGHTA